MRQAIERAVYIALVGLLLAGPAAADDPVIGNLGQAPVKASEIAEFLATLNPAQREQAAKDPKFMLQIVRNAIGDKLVLDQAIAQSWDKKPDVAAQLARLRDETIVGTFLRAAAAPPASYPNADEIRAAYDANRERFTIPRQYHVAQIFIAEPVNATKEQAAAAERKARDLAKRAKAKGANFAELARDNSDDQKSGPQGGDMGWVSEAMMLPDILGAVKALGDKGGVTEPVHAAGGWHILLVSGSKPPELRPLDQVRDYVVATLRETKTAQNVQAYLDKMLENNHLTVNETAAAALFAPPK